MFLNLKKTSLKSDNLSNGMASVWMRSHLTLFALLVIHLLKQIVNML